MLTFFFLNGFPCDLTEDIIQTALKQAGVPDGTPLFLGDTIENRQAIRKKLNSGESCILAAPLQKARTRRGLLKELKKYDAIFCCIRIVRPYSRILNDPEQTPWLYSFQPPYFWEGWHTIILTPCGYDTIDGHLLPPHNPHLDTRNVDQNNPHHTLDLYQHMAKTKRNLKDCSNAMQLAGLWHDVGKLYTRVQENGVSHFYHHEQVGAYLFLSYFLSKTTVIQHHARETLLYPAVLIADHMLPGTAWKASDRAYRKDIKYMGKELTDDLLRLHEADVNARS